MPINVTTNSPFYDYAYLIDLGLKLFATQIITENLLEILCNNLNLVKCALAHAERFDW